MVRSRFSQERVTLNSWLNKLDRLLGGDGTTFDKPSQTSTPTNAPVVESPSPKRNALNHAPTQPTSPLHVGARDLVDHLAPAAMKIESDRIHLVGEGWVRVWFVEDLPPNIGRGSLDTIYDFPGEVRVSLLTRPLDKSAVREHLRQRRTTLYAENMTRMQQGRLPDFTAQDELAETETTLRDIESSHLPPLELLWTIALYGRTEE